MIAPHPPGLAQPNLGKRNSGLVNDAAPTKAKTLVVAREAGGQEEERMLLRVWHAVRPESQRGSLGRGHPDLLALPGEEVPKGCGGLRRCPPGGESLCSPHCCLEGQDHRHRGGFEAGFLLVPQWHREPVEWELRLRDARSPVHVAGDVLASPPPRPELCLWVVYGPNTWSVGNMDMCVLVNSAGCLCW